MINLSELEIQTQDGWKLKAYHHKCFKSLHLPVLIFHAMSLSAYSLNGNGGIPSIASWLSQNGYDVWVCECRGVGNAFHQDKIKRLEWTFDDQLKYDVSAFINSIGKETGHYKFHWIGHSMGGALLLAYLCSTDNSIIQSGIIAGAGFEVSNRIGTTELQIKLLNALRIKRIPLKALAILSKPFFRFIPDQYGYFSKKLTGYTNCIEIMKDIHNIPTSLMMYSLKSYRKNGFRDINDKLIYSEKAKNVSTPLLFISGDEDLAWIPSVVEENLKFFSQGNAQILPLGKAYGHENNYGHLDLLMGKNSEKEVFPEILKFLNLREKERAA
jgi:predicted alpha/beta hydrolase